MDTTSGTVTVWQSGRLARAQAARRFEISREQWLGAALLLLSAIVLTMFVGVLRDDVAGGPSHHFAQRSPAATQVADTSTSAAR
jgi:hypothetical protein